MKLFKYVLTVLFLCFFSWTSYAQFDDSNIETSGLLSFPDNYNLKKVIGVIDNELYAELKANKTRAYGVIKFNERMEADEVVMIPKTVSGEEVDYLSSQIVDGNIVVLVDVIVKKDYRVYGYTLDLKEMKLSSPKLIMSYPMKPSEYKGMSRWLSKDKKALGIILNLESNVKKEGLKKFYASIDGQLNYLIAPQEISIPAYDKEDGIDAKYVSKKGEFYTITYTKYKGKQKQDSDYEYYLNKLNLEGKMLTEKINLNGNDFKSVKLIELENQNIVAYGMDRKNGFLDHYVVFFEFQNDDLKVVKESYEKISTKAIVDHAHKSYQQSFIEKIDKGKKFESGGSVVVEGLKEGLDGQYWLLANWNHDYISRKYSLVIHLDNSYQNPRVVNIANCQAKYNLRAAYVDDEGGIKVIFEDNALNKDIASGEPVQYVNQNFDNEELQNSPTPQLKSMYSEVKQEVREVQISGDDEVKRLTLVDSERLSAKADAQIIFADVKEKGAVDNPRFRTNFDNYVISDGYLYVYQTAKLSFKFKILEQQSIIKYIARFIKIKL